jgi:preprotein translocase subunit SecA
MDGLPNSVGLREYIQHDPLNEYKNEVLACIEDGQRRRLFPNMVLVEQ